MNSAEIIKTVRERAGFSKRELERRIGVTYGHVSKWENQGVVPRMDLFVAVMQECGHEIIIKPKESGYYSKDVTRRRHNWK